MILSAIVLTKNEESNIADCLATLQWVNERLIVDSGSSDRTCVIARELGARVVEHPMRDFADQRNFAMAQAKGDWVLFIDADERVTPELVAEINAITCPDSIAKGKLADLAVYAIPRRTYFFGKELRFGDSRGDAPIRLFPRGRVRWDQPVHEIVRTDLPYRRLKNPLSHYSTRDLAHYMQKVREYVPLEHAAMREKGIRTSFLGLILMPPARFIHLYFWKLGILDGITGFQYAILSSYYSFLKHWMHFRAR
jgi:glycosyltransferase involved in cell wall biosynthesis